MNLLAIAAVLIGSAILLLVGAPELLGRIGVLKFDRMPINGMTPAMITQFFRDPGHNGTDIAVPVGTPIVNVAPGVVVNVIDDNRSGKAIIVRGRVPFTPTIGWGYAHLSRIDVVKGQEVEAGEIIGATGNTGASQGPHLHFTVLDVPRGFDGIDPEPFLPESIRSGNA